MNLNVPKNISPQELNIWLLNDLPNIALIDVREDDELSIAPFPSQVIHLPLTKISSWGKTLSQELSKYDSVVVICHMGVRSWNFGLWLLEQPNDFEVFNLNGGIEAWSLEIDKTVPRY